MMLKLVFWALLAHQSQADSSTCSFRLWTPKSVSDRLTNWLIAPFKANINSPDAHWKANGGAFGQPSEAKFISRNGSNLGQYYVNPSNPESSSDVYWLAFRNGTQRAYRSSSFSQVDQDYVRSVEKDGVTMCGDIVVRAGIVTTYPECQLAWAPDQIPNDALKVRKTAVDCDALDQIVIHITEHFAIHIGSNTLTPGWQVIRTMQSEFGANFDFIRYVALTLEEFVFQYEKKFGSPVDFDGFKMNVFICGTGFMDCTVLGDTTGIRVRPESTHPTCIDLAWGFVSAVDAMRKSFGFGTARPDAWVFADTHARYQMYLLRPAHTVSFDPFLKQTHFGIASVPNRFSSWLWMVHLQENEGFPSGFMTQLWNLPLKSADGLTTLEDPVETIMRLATQRGIWAHGAIGFGDAMARFAARLATMDFVHRQNYMDSMASRSFSYFTPLKKVSDRADWYRPSLDAYFPYTFGINVLLLRPDPNKEVPFWTFGIRGFSASTNIYAGVSSVVVFIFNNGTTLYLGPLRFGTVTIQAYRDLRFIAVGVSGAPQTYTTIAQSRCGYATNRQFGYEIYAPHWVPAIISTGDSTRTGDVLIVHPNGGGLKSVNAIVDATAYIGLDAVVYGTARVLGNAKVLDGAVVGDSAIVRDNAIVCQNATVAGRAIVQDNAFVCGQSIVNGSAIVYGNAVILDRAFVNDSAQVGQNASVLDSAIVAGNAQVIGQAVVMETAIVGGNLIVNGFAILRGSTVVEFSAVSIPPGRQEITGTAILGRYCLWRGYQYLAFNPKAVDRGRFSGQMSDLTISSIMENEPATFMVANYDFDYLQSEVALDAFDVNDAILRGLPTIYNEGGKSFLRFQGNAYMVLPQTAFSHRTWTAAIQFRFSGTSAVLLRVGNTTHSIAVSLVGSNSVFYLNVTVTFRNQVVAEMMSQTRFVFQTWYALRFTVRDAKFISVIVNNVNIADLYLPFVAMPLLFRGDGNYVAYAPGLSVGSSALDVDNVRIYRSAEPESTIPLPTFGDILNPLLQITADVPCQRDADCVMPKYVCQSYRCRRSSDSTGTFYLYFKTDDQSNYGDTPSPPSSNSSNGTNPDYGNTPAPPSGDYGSNNGNTPPSGDYGGNKNDGLPSGGIKKDTGMGSTSVEDCQNGGTLLTDGSCDCPDGYKGRDCSVAYSPEKGLGTGLIVGIVVACCLGVAMIVGALVYRRRADRRSLPTAPVRSVNISAPRIPRN